MRTMGFGGEGKTDAEGHVGVQAVEGDTLLGETPHKAVGSDKEVETAGVEREHATKLCTGAGEGRAEADFH